MDYLQAIADAGLDPSTVGRYRIMDLFGCNEYRAKLILKEIRTASANVEVIRTATGKPSESQEHLADGTWNIYLDKTRIKSKEELFKQFGIKESEYVVERLIVNAWEVGVSTDAGVVTEPLYQVKATLKPNSTWNVAAVREEVARLKASASKEIKRFNINKYVAYGSDKKNALEISIADPHIGKLAWGEETLGPNYDSKIASSLYTRAYLDILSRSRYDLSKICLVIGNDLFNFDSRIGATTNGTPQSADSRYRKMFQVVWDMVSRQIATALEIAPVDVVICEGNHDGESAWHLGHSLECFYAGNKHVNIDNSPAMRKYWQYGKSMVLLTHGNNIKLKQLPLLLATERPEMFAATTHREAHVGHWHQTNVSEASEGFGIRTRILPSLCPADYWHSTMGYVNNIRAAQGFVWNHGAGLIEIKEFSVPKMEE